MTDPVSRTIGVVPLDQARAISGLELLQGWLAGRFPSPPISTFINGNISEVARGRVVFEGTPTRDHYNPLGSVHGGYSGVLLDSCMGCAVHTMLEAGQGYTTLEFKVNLVRGMSEKTGPVRAIGTVLQSGSRVALAEGRLVDREDRLLAFATTTCLIFPI